MVDYAALKTELETDPLVRGYSGMTDQQIADDMNTVYRTGTVTELSASQLFEAIEDSDWDTRTADQREKIKTILSLGDNIQIAPGTKARAMMASALTGATASLANLGSLESPPISRAVEVFGAAVDVAAIESARAYA